MDTHEGVVYKLYSYFGIIEFLDNNKERYIPFFINGDESFYVGEKLKFEIYLSNNKKVRGTYLQFAIVTQKLDIDLSKKGPVEDIMDPISIINKNLKGYDIKDEKALNIFKEENGIYDNEDYLSYLMEKLNTSVDVETLKAIIKQDKKFKSFILKWTLYLEAKVRNKIIVELMNKNITFLELNNHVEKEQKGIACTIKKALKKVGDKYLLKTSPSNIKYQVLVSQSTESNNKDDLIPKAQSASFDEVISCFTLGDLLSFLKYLQKEYKVFQNFDWTEIYNCMSAIRTIRNVAAHGDDFTSLILDAENNPNILLQGNVEIYGKDNVYLDKEKDSPIFNLIRPILHLEMKRDTQNSQSLAVIVSEKLLGNPTLFSLLNLFYLMNKDTLQKNKFNSELKKLINCSIKFIDLTKIEKEDRSCNNRFWNKINELFDYLKQNQLEASPSIYSEDNVYCVNYLGSQIMIDLGDNAAWIMKFLRKDEQKFRDKAIFLFNNDNYEKLQIMFRRNYHLQENNPLDNLTGFNELRDVLNLFIDQLPYIIK